MIKIIHSFSEKIVNLEGNICEQKPWSAEIPFHITLSNSIRGIIPSESSSWQAEKITNKSNEGLVSGGMGKNDFSIIFFTSIFFTAVQFVLLLEYRSFSDNIILIALVVMVYFSYKLRKPTTYIWIGTIVKPHFG